MGQKEMIRMRSGEPLVRKLSLVTQEGALGYWTPQLLPLLNVQWLLWRLPSVCGQNTPPPPLWGRLGGRVCWPHGGAVCHSLPTVTHTSPFKSGE